MTDPQLRNLNLDAAVELAEARYAAKRPRSQAHMQGAAGSLPGGNTRTVIHFRPFPFVVARSEGCYLHDIDGHRYRDFLGEYTAGLFGHSDPAIKAALSAALEKGWVHGGHIEEERQLADALVARFPSIELVRFCNSGTEANLMAIVTARVFTKRPKIMVFSGGYHGGVLKYANGPASTNVPLPLVEAGFNDIEGSVRSIENNSDELAAVLIEPMQGSAGCISPAPGFLEALREACTRAGALLIFDEVMTSRLSPGGLQQALDVTPDLTTLGKYLGGGVPLGAFGGRADVMALYDPNTANALGHAGTFNNNQFSMAAGVATMTQVYTPETAIAHNERGDRFRSRLNQIAGASGLPIQFTGLGSMMNAHFSTRPIHRIEDVNQTSQEAKRLFHLEMLARGYYCAGRGMINLSLPMADDDLDGFAEALSDFLTENQDLLSTL